MAEIGEVFQALGRLGARSHHLGASYNTKCVFLAIRRPGAHCPILKVSFDLLSPIFTQTLPLSWFSLSKKSPTLISSIKLLLLLFGFPHKSILSHPLLHHHHHFSFLSSLSTFLKQEKVGSEGDPSLLSCPIFILWP